MFVAVQNSYLPLNVAKKYEIAVAQNKHEYRGKKIVVSEIKTLKEAEKVAAFWPLLRKKKAQAKKTK